MDNNIFNFEGEDSFLKEVHKSQNKVDEFKIKFGRKMPFFAEIFNAIILVPLRSTEISTCGVNKNGILFYNPEYINSLSSQDLEAAICHEILHVIFLHPESSISKKDQSEIANISQDLIINQMLDKDQIRFTDPENYLVPSENKFHFKKGNSFGVESKGYTVKDIDKKSYEMIYNELKNVLKKSENKSCSSCQSFKAGKLGEALEKSINEGKTSFSKSEIEELELHIGKTGIEGGEDFWDQKIADAIIKSQISKHGTPLGMEELFNARMYKTRDWKALLRRYIQKSIPVDSTYRKVKEYNGFLNPTIKRENIDFVLMLDTSGSISEYEFSGYIYHLKRIFQSFPNVNVSIVCIDSTVQYTVELKKFEPNKIKFKGRGGNNFTPAFKWLKSKRKQRNIPVIIFGDGYFDDPEYFGYHNVLWVINDKEGFKNNFSKGKKIFAEINKPY